MYHLIEFNTAFATNREASPQQRLERLRIRNGTRPHVSLGPYGIETAGELDEVTDVFFEDGTVTRQVPFAWFRFVE